MCNLPVLAIIMVALF